MAVPSPAMRHVTPATSRYINTVLPHLPSIPLFSQLPPALLPTFLSYFHVLSLPSESRVLDPTNAVPTFHLVVYGSIASFTTPTPSPSSAHTLLRPGDAFGLSSLLTSTPLTTSCYATVDDSELLCITRAQYDAFLASQTHSAFPAPTLPALPAILSTPPSSRSPDALSALCSLLVASSRLFHSFDRPALLRLASYLYPCSANTGDVIQTADEESDALLIVLSGSCSVHAALPHTAARAAQRPTSRTSAPASTRSSRHVGDQTRRLMEEERHRDDVLRLHQRRRDVKLAAMTNDSGEVSPQPQPWRFRPSAAAVGPCVALLLPTSATEFTDSALAPSFCSTNAHTVVAREPTTFAYVSAAYLSHVLASFHKPYASYAAIRQAVTAPPKSRPEPALAVLDALLKNLSFFQFKQSRVRRALCQCLQLRRVGAGRVLHAQGESSELYWIVLSGSVSIHAREDVVSVWAANAHQPLDAVRAAQSPRDVNVSHLESLVDVFGPCQSVARPLTAFNEAALVVSSARATLSTSAITRTACELLCLSKADYAAVCEPSSDLSSHSDVIIRYMAKREDERSGEDQERLLASLLHFTYFADLRADLRAMVVASMEAEEVEAEVRLFEEGEATDETSCMFIIVSGMVGVHLADAKQKQRREQQQQAEERERRTRTTASPRNTASPRASRPSTALVRPAGSLPPISSPLQSPRSPRGGARTVRTVGAAGRVSVSQLTPGEVTSLYGPSVTVLPTGSHFGDVAFSSSQSTRRSATCITVEPCYFLKLPRDVVQKVAYLSTGGRGTSDAAVGHGGRVALSQSGTVAALSATSLFGGIMTSLSLMKRMAFHVESRFHKMGEVLAVQGEKPEAVLVIVDGAGVLSRRYTVLPPHGKPAKPATARDGRPLVDGDSSSQGLHQPSLVVHASSVPASCAWEFALPLSTLSTTSALCAYEALHALPLSASFTVTSVECHVLAIRRMHFLGFYGGLSKGLARLEDERRDRERWWADVLHAEVDKRVRQHAGGAGDHGDDQHRTPGQGKGKHQDAALSVAELSHDLQAMDIAATTAYTHLSRFAHLAAQAEDKAGLEAQSSQGGQLTEAEHSLRGGPESAGEEFGGLREAALIRRQTQSLSRKGVVFDRYAQQKLGRTLQQVRGRVRRNEQRMARKEDNLRRARQLVLEQGRSDVGDERRLAAVGGSREADEEEKRNDETAVSEWRSTEPDRRHEEETLRFLSALEKRRAEGSIIISPRNRRPLYTAAPASSTAPALLMPLVHTVPSIPHGSDTREDIEDELALTAPTSPAVHPSKPRRPHAASPTLRRPNPALAERSEAEPTADDVRANRALTLSFHSDSVRSWREEKQAEFERRGRGVSADGEEEERLRQEWAIGDDVAGMRRTGSSVSAAAGRADSTPTPSELLFHLERCQRNGFID